LAVLALCALALFCAFPRILPLLLAGGTTVLALGMFALLAPIALLLGVPFPVGLRLLTRSAGMRAYGWAANGVTSVLASILAVPLAMTLGITVLLLLAAVCYALMLGILLVTRYLRG
jgi:hypothetical protein